MRLQDYDTTNKVVTTVVSSDRITPTSAPYEVRDIVLDISNPEFPVEAGQNVGVLAPGQEEFGQEKHLRLYSVANVPERTADGHLRIHLCVRRCTYVDEYSGERYHGVASNYLCDLRPGNTLTLTGPYGQPFDLPTDPEATLILIGAGTGTAPFRALVNRLYKEMPNFKGRIFFFHGGQTKLDLLYMNDERDDFAPHYDKDSFEAIAVLAKRPHWSDSIDWDSAMQPRAQELWDLLTDSQTYVYVAGLEQIRDELNAVFSKIAGAEDLWEARKAELEADGRWAELLY